MGAPPLPLVNESSEGFIGRNGGEWVEGIVDVIFIDVHSVEQTHQSFHVALHVTINFISQQAEDFGFG